MEPESTEQPVPPQVPHEIRPSLLTRMFRNGWQYFFQFFMLFLAVAAGFFADNLREDFSERKQAEEYAGSMETDLRRDSLNISFQIAVLKTAVKKIDDLAGYVRGKKITELNNLDLYRHTQIFPNPAFRWSRATLEQIKSSGSLRHFSNDSVAYVISHYDAFTQHLDQDNLDDQQTYRRAADLQNRIVDMNYPEEIKNQISAGSDSAASTALSYSLPLLTSDLNDIKAMVNAYLIAKNNSAGRISELLMLQRDQRRLSRLLKHEYRSPKDQQPE